MVFNPIPPVRVENRDLFPRDPAERIQRLNNPNTANPAPREPDANPHLEVVNAANLRIRRVAPGPITAHDMSVAIQNIEHAERDLLNDGGGDAARIQAVVGVMIRDIANGNQEDNEWEEAIRDLADLNRGDQDRRWFFNDNDIAGHDRSNAFHAVLNLYRDQNWE